MMWLHLQQKKKQTEKILVNLSGMQLTFKLKSHNDTQQSI